jgi:hypothetical protein
MDKACTCCARATHEDWAIVSINPLPQMEVFFPNIGEVAHEFLVHRRQLRIRDIQKTHLGQTLVPFALWRCHIYFCQAQ